MREKKRCSPDSQLSHETQWLNVEREPLKLTVVQGFEANEHRFYNIRFQTFDVENWLVNYMFEFNRVASLLHISVDNLCRPPDRAGAPYVTILLTLFLDNLISSTSKCTFPVWPLRL